MSKLPEDCGVGLDCGTMNFVSARRSGKKVTTARVRDAFIDLPPEHKRMLKLSNTAFAEIEGKLIVVGDDALNTANLLNREARRPLQGGLISAGELDAQTIISLMMKQILGDPKKDGEKCCYSVPSAAVDVGGSDVTYHSAILGKIVNELGYKAEPANEALAIVFSECTAENFCGLGISYGSGMTNVSLAYNAMSALEFSLGRGGDWIDNGAARAVGSTKAKMCAIKESGIDITKPKDRNEEAIALFISTLIDYTIDNIIAQFVKVKSELLVPKPIPIIVSGGTSLAGGFLEKFQERFEQKRDRFPIQISEVRPAGDPMTAVATGLLVLSQMED
jgi:actin-like ATPase involved in cell morphogenesis